jgi:hypothetical protein
LDVEHNKGVRPVWGGDESVASSTGEFCRAAARGRWFATVEENLHSEDVTSTMLAHLQFEHTTQIMMEHDKLLASYEHFLALLFNS